MIASLLTVEVGYSLPDFNTINVYFMKEIINKQKKAIKVNNMKYLFVPQYASLSVCKILAFVKRHQ